MTDSAARAGLDRLLAPITMLDTLRHMGIVGINYAHRVVGTARLLAHAKGRQRVRRKFSELLART